MKPLYAIFAVLILMLAAPSTLWGRGCMIEGTAVETPAGPVPVEKLRAGDRVWAIAKGQRVAATVQSCYEVAAQKVISLRAGGFALAVTPEHPIAIGPGLFRDAADLHAGDHVQLWDGQRVSDAALETVKESSAAAKAYNLLVWPGGTFIAGGIIVHNKGCFLPDTPVELADGTEERIDQINPGDRVRAFTPEGHLVNTTVLRVLAVQADDYFLVQTQTRLLSVTAEHPFFVGHGTFQTIESLHVGDSVYVLHGGDLRPERITGLEHVAAPVTVYNLQTDEPNTFFAHGVAVHNKGCFPAGTSILTPTGSRPIEQLAVGDAVLGVTTDGRTVSAPVLAIHQARDQIWTVATRYGRLRTTADHPLRLWDGGFAAAEDLAPGDVLTCYDSAPRPAAVRRCRRSDSETPVFNLTVGGPHTFIADHFVVHNKGGCMAAGTRVLAWPAAAGRSVAIEDLRPGDSLAGIDQAGHLVGATVSSLYKETGTVLEISTARGILHTTPEHPIAVSGGRFIAAEQLRAGERINCLAGGRVDSVAIISLTNEDVPQTVYNLTVDGPHTFLADGFVVHNKGGGGGGFHSSHSYGGSSSGTQPWSGDEWVGWLVGGLFAVVFVGIAVVKSIAQQVSGGSDDSDELDYVYPRSQFAAKTQKTTRLAEHLARTDPSFDPAKILATARETFVELQRCWEQRHYVTMQPRLTPELYAQHILLLSQMLDQHEINRIEGLQVESVDLVHLEYGVTPAARHVTVLFTACARDYYVDDRTFKFRRGDQSPQRFQEFWVFNLIDGAWLLADIEQTKESDILRQENVVANWSPEQLQAFYRGDAVAAGPQSGVPGDAQDLPRPMSPLDQALADLAGRGPQCTTDAILTRARTLYVAVIAARQAQDPQLIAITGLGVELTQQLRDQCASQQAQQISIEYRNFCLRRAQIVGVTPAGLTGQPQCTIRVIAHAQIVRTRGQSVISQDPYEKTFEEYLVLRFDPPAWTLISVQPRA